MIAALSAQAARPSTVQITSAKRLAQYLQAGDRPVNCGDANVNSLPDCSPSGCRSMIRCCEVTRRIVKMRVTDIKTLSWVTISALASEIGYFPFDLLEVTGIERAA